MVVEGAPTLKLTTLSGKKFSFGPKNFEKTGFLVFSEKTPEKRFANLLYCSASAQTYRVAAHLILEGAPSIKLTTLLGKKFSFGPKNVEKTGFLVFSEKRFANLLYQSD